MIEGIERILGRGARSAAAIAFAATIVAFPASAQNFVVTTAAEVGGDDVSLLLGSLTLAPAMPGMSPIVHATAYGVMNDAPGTDNAWAFNPAVGIRWLGVGGFVQGTAGYAFISEPATPFFGGGEDGVTTAAHLEYWGDGNLGLQGIGNYNWSSEYLWSRGRAAVDFAHFAGGSLRAGGELGWQGDLGKQATVAGADVRRYQATQFGPVLQWVTPNLAGALSGGWKNVEVPGPTTLGTGAMVRDETWYARVELSFAPGF